MLGWRQTSDASENWMRVQQQPQQRQNQSENETNEYNVQIKLLAFGPFVLNIYAWCDRFYMH